MASYQRFDSAGVLKIELDGDSPPSRSGSYGPALAQALKTITTSLAQGVAVQSDNKGRTSDLEIVFSLKALSDGSFAVSLDPSGGNFRISMKLGSPPTPASLLKAGEVTG